MGKAAAPRRRSGADDARRTITFDFDPTAVTSAEEPNPVQRRLFWLFFELLSNKSASYDRYFRAFELDLKTLRRDVAKLRRIGTEYGFELTALREGTVRLRAFAHERRLPRAPDDGADALGALAEAFGALVAESIANVVDIGAAAPDRFLRVAAPRLVDESSVAETYRALRAAWRRGAIVRFRYPANDGGSLRERRVEPYATTYYSGRYYLVGYDTRPRVGWRQFALDRITGPISLAGSFRKSDRTLPAAYGGRDAIGLFKTAAQAATPVTVAFTPRIAEAVVARVWHAGQRVERRPDGSALLTFDVYDLDEAVRWACGFGAEALVVAPPRAVAHARETLRRMNDRYDTTSADTLLVS